MLLVYYLQRDVSIQQLKIAVSVEGEDGKLNIFMLMFIVKSWHIAELENSVYNDCV